MPVSRYRFAVLPVAAILAGLAVGNASAQQEAVRLTVDAPDVVTTIRTNRPVARGGIPASPAVDVPGLDRDTWGLMGAAEEMEGAAIVVERPSVRTLADSDDGPSTTFFIQHVPEGTTRFFALTEPGAALVDTWTEQVIDGRTPENASGSPVTIWTDTVQGDAPARP